MVKTRSSTGVQTKTICYKEIDEDEVSESERHLLVERPPKGILKKRFGNWTARLDLSQEWNLDAELPPLAQRIDSARLGKKCLPRERVLDLFKNPKVRMNVRLGQLSGFKKIPSDIVFEIASYLEPPDLLHLTRTNYWLRSLLLSKKAAPVWKRARESLGMPERPKDLSEPAYASLVFDCDCQLCGAPRIETRSLAMRITLCRSCRGTNIKKGIELLDEMELDPMEAKSLKRIFATLVPYVLWHLRSVNRAGDDSNEFFKLDYMEMAGRYLLLLENGDTKRLRNFIQLRQQATREGKRLDAGISAWKDNRASVESEICEQRKASILEKLEQCGYTSDDIPKVGEYRHNKWYQAVCIPHALKPKAWKRLFPRLKKLIEENKARKSELALFKKRKRRYDELKQRYTSFVQGVGFHPYAYIMPSFADLLQVPTFQVLIQDETKEEIDDGEWTDAISGFPNIISEYSKNVFTHANASLLETLRELQTDARSGDWKYSFEVSDLVLESVLPKTPGGFNLCTSGFAFFGVRYSYSTSDCNPLDVAIARGRGSGYDPWLGSYDVRWPWDGSYEVQRPWDGTGIKAKKAAVIVAIELLVALGMKWDEAQMANLVSLGPIFACSRCPTVNTMMTWPQLVAHFVCENYEKERWDKKVASLTDSGESVEDNGKKPYCTDYIDEHDVCHSNRNLIHPPGTVELGFVNELGARLSAAEERDSQKRSIFQGFDRAECTICRRVCMDRFYYGRKWSPEELKTHIRQYHGKEPEARDAHFTRRRSVL
ncbi:hypothetical protein SCHPADRAFT_460961 [Schizopora paradoxa]|uniref:F-box domain-containing protein n=1 Tax=Schizopora paradoxa TaxID=27342 RepID=A0A0H2RIM2_9AGAM|nr:hypothetical protein SCHPADRAFT_460961 [Schizopora paradoxa]